MHIPLPASGGACGTDLAPAATDGPTAEMRGFPD
jgi:hypothetical protein